MVYALWVRRLHGPSRMGPDEAITPLPAPWLGLRDGFPFGEASPGVMAICFDGRSSSLSGFLLETLLTDLGTDEFPSSVPFTSLSFFLWATAALILCLAMSISTKVMNGRQEKQMLISDKLCKRFTYADESIHLISKLLATAQDPRNTNG